MKKVKRFIVAMAVLGGFSGVVGESKTHYAFNQLETKGVHIEIRDRYFEFQGEKIIGESPNKMTIIEEEDGTLSCAMEIIIYG